MPQDFRYLAVEFEMEHTRLRDFSQAAGLTENVDEHDLVATIRHNEKLLLSIVSEIRDVLQRFAKSHGDEESLRSPRPEGDQPRTLGGAISSLTDNDVRSQLPSPGIFNRLRWGIFDKNEMVDLLQRLRRSNNYLHELLDGH